MVTRMSGTWIGNSQQIDRAYTSRFDEPKYPEPREGESPRDHTLRLLKYGFDLEKIAKEWFEQCNLFPGLDWNPEYEDNEFVPEWLLDGDETDLKCERKPFEVSLKEIDIPTENHVSIPHSSYRNYPNSRYIFWMRWEPTAGTGVLGIHKIYVIESGLLPELIADARDTTRDRNNWKGQRYYSLDNRQMEEIHINI